VDTLQHAAVLATFKNPPEVALQATIYDENPEPKKIHDAKCSHDWSNWWGAMYNEFESMPSKQVWTIIPCSPIPINRKIIGIRWVCAQKDDRRFQAQTVAKGFLPIPRKYFQENHSPVINNTTFHTILV
jgi:hypothetical protein